jgi:twitching motility protein PilT
MLNFQDYFKQAIDKGASDLHLVAGNKPALRVDGELIFIGEEPIEQKFLESSLVLILDANRTKAFNTNRELDFSIEIFGQRFRINLHFQSGEIGMSARYIKGKIPTPEEMNFTEAMVRMTQLKDGLILVTGPSGCGKSTTLATMVDMINQDRTSHIVTVEDPIEYIFQDKKSIVEQREVGYDTLTFANALKYVLRQDPNVIMIGEMRDSETIEAALTAAETGHLVISTLHTNSAPESISRIVDSFPSHRRQQVLVQLSIVLRGVISQQLIPKVGGGLVAAREIMINNPAVSNLINENKIAQLNTTISTNQQLGMMTMNKSLENLAKDGLIDDLMLTRYSRNAETKGIYYS